MRWRMIGLCNRPEKLTQSSRSFKDYFALFAFFAAKNLRRRMPPQAYGFTPAACLNVTTFASLPPLPPSISLWTLRSLWLKFLRRLTQPRSSRSKWLSTFKDFWRLPPQAFHQMITSRTSSAPPHLRVRFTRGLTHP